MASLPKRSKSYAFLKGKIYYFGGHLPAFGLEADTTLLVLDLNVFHSTAINNDWQILWYVEGDVIISGGRGNA